MVWLLTFQEAFDMVLLVLYVVLTFESYGVIKQLLDEVLEKSRINKVKESDLLGADNTYWDLDQSRNHKIQILKIIIHCCEENDDTQKQFDTELKNNAICM